MSIQNEIERLQFDIADSYSAVYEKGGTLPNTDERNADNLSDTIRTITTASDLNFTDGLQRNGNSVSVITPVRQTYTREEFDALSDEEKKHGLYAVSSAPDLSEANVDMGISGYWEMLVYGDGNYVMSSNGDYKMAHSTDGVTWTSVRQPFYSGANIMLYGNDKFVIVRGDKLYTSDDGVTWSSKTINHTMTHAGVYGGGKFFISNSGYASYSSDGISWTDIIIPYSTCSLGFYNGFYIGLISSTKSICISSDFADWSNIVLDIADINSFDYRYKIVAGNDIVIIPLAYSIAYSYDGETWKLANVLTKNYESFVNVVFCNGVFVAIVKYLNSKYELFVSKDGIIWNRTTVTLPISKEYVMGTDDRKVYIMEVNGSTEHVIEYISPLLESIIIDGNEIVIPKDAHKFTEGLTDTNGNISVTTPVQDIYTQEVYDALPENKKNKGFYIVTD